MFLKDNRQLRFLLLWCTSILAMELGYLLDPWIPDANPLSWGKSFYIFLPKSLPFFKFFLWDRCEVVLVLPDHKLPYFLFMIPSYLVWNRFILAQSTNKSVILFFYPSTFILLMNSQQFWWFSATPFRQAFNPLLLPVSFITNTGLGMLERGGECFLWENIQP